MTLKLAVDELLQPPPKKNSSSSDRFQSCGNYNICLIGVIPSNYERFVRTNVVIGIEWVAWFTSNSSPAKKLLMNYYYYSQPFAYNEIFLSLAPQLQVLQYLSN